MRTRFITAAAAAFAVLVAGTAGAGQTSELLNKLEVQRLVSGDSPADHVGLRDHFVTLAAKYVVDAERHESLASAFAGNPNRSWATKPGAHSARLAELARESAATARELASYHDQLAAGEAATPPAYSARFHAGEGAPAPNDRQVRALAATAKTPGDFRALEEYFVTLAAKHTKAADEHVTMARTYRVQSNRRTGSGDPAVICDRLIKLSRDSAREAEAGALLYRQLATIG